MKRALLVPVDFTDTSFNAYLYANNLAYHLDLSLVLAHAYAGTFDLKADLEIKAGMGRLDVVEEKLRSFSRWHPNEVADRFYPVETEYVALQGSAVHQVVALASSGRFDFVVAGTRDKHTLGDKWLGTVSSGIAQRSEIPVLLVPNGALFRPIKNIVVGCDERTDDDQMLRELVNLSTRFDADLHFVHVKTDDQQRFEYVKREIVEALAALNVLPPRMHFVTLEGYDIVSKLFDYTMRQDAEWLVFLSQRLTFIERVLFESVSLQAATETKVPTLMMHLDD